MLVAARKHFHTEEDLVADFDDRTGALQIYGVKNSGGRSRRSGKEISLADARRVDPNAEIGAKSAFAKPTEALGRISAQTAKQVILQKVREAERENIYSEYSGRVGELVTCVVKRIEGQDLMVDLGKTEARLPKKEQSKLESFSVGDRDPLRDQARRKGRQERGRDCVARRSRTGDAPVRAGSARDLRQHGGDQGLRARSG